MILVVGDVMTDVIVRPSGPLALGTDCPAGIAMRPGGSGANVACWAAHLGGGAAFAGRVGQADAAAQTAGFRGHGVCARLAIDPTRPTGTVVALLSPHGERSFYTDRGANLGLCEADLPDSVLEGVTALHISGHAFAAPGPRAATRALMRRARGQGKAVSVDAGSVAWLAAGGRTAFLAWAEDAALCFANAAEAALLGPDLPFAQRVVTHGAAGAQAWEGTRHATVAARPVPVADSTGAGDAAVAGFLVARGGGADLRGCLEAAVAAGSSAAAVAGGRPPPAS